MLKALELTGFKSFADKTRFEFPAGITVIVGPNGSGKSNIVDAIKWVLGEQSPKSLRGKEMADIIFKGSAAGGRKAMNMAEATIVFDNSSGSFAVDAPEVHITRRVYRNGEGEYLINSQPCRLRDIKDLFSGTGVGADAYSLIEQGKVDVLLQASPRDRRAIFEEAAGISRFKSKKIESQRRLERVDQNLLRLADIVDEVDSRLRSIRAQATKARRYKEYSDRLQELRTQVGLSDWRKLTERLKQAQSQLARHRDEADELAAKAEALEAKSLELDTQIGDVTEAIRACEAKIARNRERIATHESTIGHQRQRYRDLTQEISRNRNQLASTSTRAEDIETQLRETARRFEVASGEHLKISAHLADHERALSELTWQLDRLRDQSEARRSEYMTQMRTAASLGNEISAGQSQVAAAAASAEKRQERLDQLETLRRETAGELQSLQPQEKRAADDLKSAGDQLQRAENELAQSRRSLSQHQRERADLEGRHAAATERASVLAELERRLEGLSAGVKEVLARSQADTTGPFREVCGLVADLLQVHVESAPLIEVALGEAAQYVVLSGGLLIDLVESGQWRLSGRVGLLRMDVVPGPASPQGAELEGTPGVIGRADRFVTAAAQFAPVAEHLLGQTYLVEKLSDALRLHRATGKQLRFVTLAGELLESDGTLLAGPKHHAAGLISRRSELRALRERVAQLQRQTGQARQTARTLEQEIDEKEARFRRLAEEHRLAADRLAEQRLTLRATSERHDQLQRQCTSTEEELLDAQAQHQEAQARLRRTREELAAAEASLSEMDANIHSGCDSIDRLDAERQRHNQQATGAKVELATSQQQLEGLKTSLAQFEEARQERTRVLDEIRTQLARSVDRRTEAERIVLSSSSVVAELYLQKQSLSGETVTRLARREEIKQERDALSGQAHQLRRQVRTIEERQHKHELVAGEIRHDRVTLADRLREDYGIELAELELEPTDEQRHERKAVETEIAELRRKISNIGAVNFDALAELEELETRYKSLSGQHRDLTDAKESLEKIIEKINIDSRRLFTETLDAIRANFKVLFRRVFGGGRADIVLDEGVDVLEAGVEIVATPPGKHSLSISLLSGGEKALTAVTLLMAIFQFRPSPFCVLDEVDGPLDEANIGRFLDTLKDFLTWTRFVIVTHSKKTMTAANTLYGVTMQESGVSKRVSVQFDDVSEDGHILAKAPGRSGEDDADKDERGAA